LRWTVRKVEGGAGMYWLLLIALQLLLPIDGWSAWQEDWAALQKAAKQEGKLVLIGPAGSDRRDSLVLPFQQKFGVSVEYLPDPAPLIPTRVATERQAGRYLLDVVIAGALEDILLPLKVLEPMEQFFVLPEITNPKNWRGGAIEYIDSDRTILIMTPFQRGVLFVTRRWPRRVSLNPTKIFSMPNGRARLSSTIRANRAPVKRRLVFFTFIRN
jgi:hypothetical protein